MRRELRRRSAGDHNELKAAWRELVHAIGKGARVGALIGQPEGRVSEYGSPGSDRSPAIDAVLELETEAGVPAVTAALAALQGFRLVPVDAGEDGALVPLLARVGAEVGEAFGAFALAAADGRFSARERATLAREFGDVERAVGKILAALRGAT